MLYDAKTICSLLCCKFAQFFQLNWWAVKKGVTWTLAAVVNAEIKKGVSTLQQGRDLSLKASKNIVSSQGGSMTVAVEYVTHNGTGQALRRRIFMHFPLSPLPKKTTSNHCICLVRLNTQWHVLYKYGSTAEKDNLADFFGFQLFN